MRILIVATAALFLAPAAYSTDSAVSIGSERLTLGMSEAPLLDNLKSFYHVECERGVVTNCFLMSRNGPPIRAIANLVFEDGKLSHVRKYWSDDYQGSDPVAFARSLHHLLSAMADSGSTTAVLTASEHRQPGVTRQAIHITKGRKTIVIDVTEGLQSDGKQIPTYVNLDEVIE